MSQIWTALTALALANLSLSATAQTPLDLLLVIDNSSDMSEEQAIFVEGLPRYFQQLTTGDIDQDSESELPAFPDLQVGVITTDMGSRGFAIPSCSLPMFGDDGILRGQGAPLPGCAANYPLIQTFAGSAAAFAQDVGCVAIAGTGGCAFEQPLEAALKAVTPSTSPLRFFMDTVGHGDGANVGLVRTGSRLVVLILSSENDCSAEDPDLFNPSSGPYAGTDLSLRCFEHADALHPVQRFIDGLAELRPDPDNLVLVLLAGIPPDLVDNDAATILADPRMQETIDSSIPTALAASCSSPDSGSATPPVRGVIAGQQLTTQGYPVVFGSTCQGSYEAALTLSVETIALAGELIFRDGFE